MKIDFITYTLKIDDYMTGEAGEDRYDVVRLEVWHSENESDIESQIEYENCTLDQAIAHIRELFQARADRNDRT